MRGESGRNDCPQSFRLNFALEIRNDTRKMLKTYSNNKKNLLLENVDKVVTVEENARGVDTAALRLESIPRRESTRQSNSPLKINYSRKVSSQNQRTVNSRDDKQRVKYKDLTNTFTIISPTHA